MADEQKQPDDVAGGQFAVPDISSAAQAFLFMAYGFAYFVKNYKKSTVIVLILLFMLASQYLTNFEQAKGLAKLVGVNME